MRQIVISLRFLSTAVLPRTNLASCSTNVDPAVSGKTLALPLLEHQPLQPEKKHAYMYAKEGNITTVFEDMSAYL